MNYRIILWLILTFIILYSLKFKKNTKDLEFSKNDSLNLKGLFCLLVIIGHLASWTNKEPIFSFSSNFGFFAVAGFLFISGYGLTKSKNNKLSKFIKKLLILIIPFILINFVFYLVLNLVGTKTTIMDTLKSLVNFYPIAYFSWYVVAIIIFYILFFITNKIFKKPLPIVIALFIEITIYNFLTYHFGLIYSWWLSNYAFVLGTFIAYDFKCISDLLKKHYKLIFSVIFVLFLFTLDVQFILEKGFGTIYNALISWACITAFPFLIYLFLQKFELNSKSLSFIGKYSYEIYLVQGLPLLLLRSKYLTISNDFIYTVLCILASIIIGILFYYINNFIYKIIKLKS